jgi:hypothetical protein
MFDALATILARANEASHIQGAVSHLIPGGVTHLQYEDDTMILIDPSMMGIENLKLLLLCFENMSRIKINFTKSEAVATGATEAEKLRVDNSLNYKLGRLPMS